MGFSLRTVGRNLRGFVPGNGAMRRLRRIEALTRRIDHFTLGSTATYVGDNRVLVRVIAGEHAMILYVHADDKLISPWLIVNGEHEPDLTDYFVRNLRPDSHCLDVGANIGYFACLMGKFCPRGRVIGLEPNPVVQCAGGGQSPAERAARAWRGDSGRGKRPSG